MISRQLQFRTPWTIQHQKVQIGYSPQAVGLVVNSRFPLCWTFGAQGRHTRHYEKEAELAQKESVEDIIKKELGGSIGDISRIEGLLLLKQNEADKKQRLLDAFDFRQIDKDKTKIVDPRSTTGIFA